MNFNQILSLLLKYSIYVVLILIFLAGMVYGAR